MAQVEVKKMKQGMSYSCKEKTIILNVFKYFRQQFPDKSITDLVRRTAKATGCSEKSVFQFRKEEASVEGFKEPSKTKIRKNININSRDIKYDANVRQAIRDIIYELKCRNIVPSLNTILKQINTDTQLPNFSVMTLRRLLFDMGFFYEKDGTKYILVEKDEKSISSKDQNLKENNKKINTFSNNADTSAHLNNSNNVANKPIYQVPHGEIIVNSNHINPIHNQGHRIMHMPVTQSGNMVHRMPPPPPPIHNMPMMINHRNDFAPLPEGPPLISIRPPSMDIRLKCNNTLWMQPPLPPPAHSMVKQE